MNRTALSKTLLALAVVIIVAAGLGVFLDFNVFGPVDKAILIIIGNAFLIAGVLFSKKKAPES